MISWMIVILSFVIIILLHELGHYLVARCFGVAVARFSIGFGRPIFLWRSKKQLTKFTFAPILLGGFVQFAEKSKKNYRLFSELASWKKILILLAGPAVNLLIAMAVLSVVLKADIYEPKAISIAEFGIKRAKKSGPKTAFSKSVLRKLNQL